MYFNCVVYFYVFDSQIVQQLSLLPEHDVIENMFKLIKLQPIMNIFWKSDRFCSNEMHFILLLHRRGIRTNRVL